MYLRNHNKYHFLFALCLIFLLTALTSACNLQDDATEAVPNSDTQIDAGDVSGADDTDKSFNDADTDTNQDPDANRDNGEFSVTLYIYDDELISPWIDASWDAEVNLEATAEVFSGDFAIEVTQEAGGSLSFRHGDWDEDDQNLESSNYESLSFEIYSEESLDIDLLFEGDGSYQRVNYGVIPTGEWTTVTMPVSDLVLDNGDFRRVDILESSGSTITYYVDQVRLIGEETNDNDTSGPADSEFVTVDPDNPRFLVDGEPFYFAGTNLYWLFQRYTYGQSDMVDDAFEMCEEIGLRVVRTWGFADGHNWTGSDDPAILQPTAGEFNESTFEALDYVIAKAAEHDVRLIIPLVNYWGDYGGMIQYAQWAGGDSYEYFYTNEDARQLYKNFVYEVLTRENSITGVEYREDPTIMAWQLANEARGRFDANAENGTLLDWYTEMAAYVRSIDPNHLIGTGEEGWDIQGYSDQYSDDYTNRYALRGEDGSSYVDNTALSDISFGGAHLYPDVWGFSDAAEDGKRWITDHVAIAQENDKPFVLGEFGYSNRDVYQDWLQVIDEQNAAGSLMWQIVPESRGVENEMTIVYPHDSELIEVFSEHAAIMNAK